MSTHQSGNPRRRRIAGERRGRTVPTDDQTTVPVEDAPAQDERVEPAPPPPPLTGSHPLEDHIADESDTTGDASSGGWWGSRASLLALSGLLALLLLLAGLTALGALGTDSVGDINKADAVEQAERTAPAAAEAAAEAILAYDVKSLSADQDTAARFMTDEFAEEYADTFEKVVRPAAEKTRAKVTASVLASSTMMAGEDTARVLLFVDQATTSTSNERPQIALNRVEMSMVRDGDSWLVSDISSY